MVGDAGTDVGVARRANVPVIGVNFGYTDVPDRGARSPIVVIGHMSDLPAAVASLLVSRHGLAKRLDLLSHQFASRDGR